MPTPWSGVSTHPHHQLMAKSIVLCACCGIPLSGALLVLSPCRESSPVREDVAVTSDVFPKERGEKASNEDEDEDSDGETQPKRRNLFQEKTAPVSSTEASSLPANASFTGFSFRKKARGNMRQRNTEL